MELNRLKIVQKIIKKLDIRILNFLNEDTPDSKELLTFIELRSIYIQEYEGLSKSINTHEMFKKENGYGK